MTEASKQRCEEHAKECFESREKLKTEVLVKMQLLIGCCRTSSITKKQIEKSIQEFVKKLESK